MIEEYAVAINTSSLAICCVITYSIFLRLRIYQIVYGYINIFMMWALVSTYANDLGDYNFELQRHTYTTLASSYLAFLYALFNLGFYLAYKYSEKLELTLANHRHLRLPSSPTLQYLSAAFVLTVLGINFVSAAGQAQAVLQGYLSRADSLDDGNALSGILMAYPFLAPALLGNFANIQRGGFKIISLVGLSIYLISLVLLGNKFSGLFEALFYFLASSYFYSTNNQHYYNSSRLLKVLVNWRTICVISVLSYLIYLSYTKIALGSFSTLLELLYDRIFLFQGQLFWSSFVDYVSNRGPSESQLLVEVNKILGDKSVANSEVGMQFVMIKALGTPAYIIIEKGFLYTMAFPGVLLYMVDYFYICLIMLVLGALFMLVTLFWRVGVAQRSLALQLLSLSIFGPFISLLFTGNLSVVFTLLFVLKVFLLTSVLAAGARK